MFNEINKIVPIAHALDLATAATNDCDSLYMRHFHKAAFIFAFDTLGGASSVLTINSGATEGTVSSALSFNYAWGGAAIGTAVAASVASCDVLTAWTNAATLTITHGTYSDYMLIVEINAAAMDMANDEDWLTARFTDPGGSTGTLDAWAILEPRYASNRSATALK